MNSASEKRKYPRLQAAILWRRAESRDRKPGADISEGGVCLFADEPHRPGELLDLEVFTPGGELIACRVEVVWIEPLAMGAAPARFEMGVKFVSVSESDRARIADLVAGK